MAVAQAIGSTQFLTFKLDNEVYGVNVENVRNILEHTPVTKIPKMPDYMLGVINARGGVLPVLDMRLKFGLLKGEQTVDTCIIVVEVCFDNEIVHIGALVDSVEEVIELEPENIEPAPKIGDRLEADFIKGVGKRNEQFIMLLGIEEVFLEEEITLAESSGNSAALESKNEPVE